MIAIIDYGMGNLHSVSKAVERLGCETRITSDARDILAAEKIILPGVGAFGDAMKHLRETGLDRVVLEAAGADKPLLGICLGMQLLFTESEEHGLNRGLDLLPGRAVRFKGQYKIPHMGWNKLEFLQESPLLRDLDEGYVYFVHSYHVETERQSDLLAAADYHGEVAAVVGRGKIYGMQFHPEKSGTLGMSLLERFLKTA